MIGQGMWWNKGSKPKLKNSFHSSFFTFSKEECEGVIAQIIKEKQYEDLVKEALELDRALKKLQPKDRIKIKLNSAEIPDCHYPHQIIQTHVRKAELISEFVVCGTKDSRIHMLPRIGERIKISVITCASEEMCQQYLANRACIKKFDHQLYIVPPQVGNIFVTCLIEYPINLTFNLERMDVETFMKKFEQEAEISSDDSSDLDFLSSNEEKEEQEL